MNKHNDELLKKIFTDTEIEDMCKRLLNRIQTDIYDFLSNAWGFEMTEDELKELIASDEEFIKITRCSMMNAVSRCNFEKIILFTLVELQKELTHFSINMIPLNKGNENAKS